MIDSFMPSAIISLASLYLFCVYVCAFIYFKPVYFKQDYNAKLDYLFSITKLKKEKKEKHHQPL